MPINDRDLKPSTNIAARCKGETFRAEIVQSDDGIAVRLDDRSFSASAPPALRSPGHTR